MADITNKDSARAKELGYDIIARCNINQYINKLKGNDPIFNEEHFPTGFEQLDKALGGGLIAGVHTIGAISSLGKTTFALQIADNIAAKENPVLVYSLEMRPEVLVAKTISRSTYIEATKSTIEEKDPLYMNLALTYTDIMNQKHRDNLRGEPRALYDRAVERVSAQKNLIIISENEDKNRPFTISDITDSIYGFCEISAKKPIVIIDYLQFIQPDQDMSGTDKQILDAIVSQLISTAKSLRIPIIVISSLNRASYDTPISLSSFNGSGFIEYSSETVIGLQLEGVGTPNFDVNKAKAEEKRKIEAVILKGRSVQVGQKIKYEFCGKYNYFEEKKEKENKTINIKNIDLKNIKVS